MKRLVLTIALIAALSISAFAQTPISSIILNAHDPETGMRSLGTEHILIRGGFTDEHPIELGMIALETSAGWVYSLQLTVAELVSRPLPEGGILLIKTTKGDIIELTNHCTELTSQDIEGDLISGTTSFVYHNRASYTITTDQIMKIGREGVQKIRIQTKTGHYDTEYKKDQWGKVISAHIRAIQAEANKKTDIRSDF